METFGARVHAAIERRGNLCVGIDPHAELLRAWGLTDDATGLETFAMTCVEALAPEVAVLKPQSAFFERHGSRGIAVLERVVAESRAAGALILLDVKRGDVGSTMEGYAEAYLDQTSSLAVDAVTLTPYLGFESLRPALDLADRNGAAVFVVTLTSNPEGERYQRARTADGRTVAGEVLDAVRAENAGRSPLGSVGVVIGATVQPSDLDLEVNGPVLAPGYGAQGGSPAALAALFGPTMQHVLPSTSRAVLAAGPSVQALRDAAQACRDELQAVAQPAG